ncbi:MAG: type III-B CRISPR-associated protein Cas10/Cmr2 [Ignavibacteria bacterium]|jgi:CRISPR-associated protein Cmr2|nr:type III-B CRISPR-associated protein Cas10/Cmr2 [Ignavibacteria bacterium]
MEDNNTTYTAINIGPIVSTIQMARKPRELWAASYLFSHLMECIIETLPKNGIDKDDIISPAILNSGSKNLGVGLYPDRVFFRNNLEKPFDEQVFFKEVFKKIEKTKFTVKINNKDTIKKLKQDFFNIMITSLDISSKNEESEAIRKLNQALDKAELFNIACKDEDTKNVRKLISLRKNSPLFKKAFGKTEFPIETLGEIAAKQLSILESNKWESFVNDIKSDDKETAEKAYSFSRDNLKSYHKYICVVQADGDNVGKTVTHKDLPNGKVKEISKALLEFGKKATEEIKEYGGLPIYAGGDDLLFIAPVVGKKEKGDSFENIFDLLEKLNKNSFSGVADKVKECGLTKDGKLIEASLSFGVSITYYKYPLYEALESARDLLFGVAKNIEGKNAIALDMRKHSGGAFSISFSKTNTNLATKFDNMIKKSQVEDALTSAVANKISNSEGLLKLWIGSNENIFTERNKAFFEKYIEYDSSKTDINSSYKQSALDLLNELYKTKINPKMSEQEKKKNTSEIIKTMYGMLRVAKFINGEEDKQ